MPDRDELKKALATLRRKDPKNPYLQKFDRQLRSYTTADKKSAYGSVSLYDNWEKNSSVGAEEARKKKSKRFVRGADGGWESKGYQKTMDSRSSWDADTTGVNKSQEELKKKFGIKTDKFVTYEEAQKMAQDNREKPTGKKQDNWYSDFRKRFEKRTGSSSHEKRQGPSFVKDATKAAAQFFNPFDEVSAEDAVKNFINRKSTKQFDEFARGANRAVDSASLGAMSNMDKKLNKRTPYYTSERKMGEGGGKDMISTGIGYLTPGLGMYKWLNASKPGMALTKMGAQGLKQRLASEAAKGAITGAGMTVAETGVKEGLNPKDQDWKENVANVVMGTTIGAVADPALYGAGKAIGKGAEKAGTKIIKKLLPSDEQAAKAIGNVLKDTPKMKPKEYTLPDGKTKIKSRVADKLKEVQTKIEAIQPEKEAYDKELQEAIQQQYEYLKNSMGKGTTPGGLIKDKEGYVTGAFGRQSNNPKWYQNFYKQNGRRPTNQELRELAERHVREGFQDELGDIPPWKPKAIQELDDQITEVTNLLKENPDQEAALKPVLEALEQDKQAVFKTLNKTSSIKGLQEQAGALERQIKPLQNFKTEAITPMKDGGKLVRLKPGEAPRSFEPISIENPKNLVKQQIDTKPTREKTKWSFDKAMTAMVDDLRPIMKASKELGGKDLAFDKNPYNQARLSRGVAGRAETYLRGGIFDESGKKVGASLQEIIKPIEKKFDDFLAYSTSKRALDYDMKGLQAGIKPKNIEGISDRQLAEATIRQIEAESPEMKQVHEQLLNYNNRLMDELVDAGVLDKDTVLSLRKENPNYIPMFRVPDKKVRGFQPLGSPKNKYANLGEPFKKRTGSEKPIINPVESIIKNTYLTLNMAERNKVGSSLLELVEGTGENSWGRVVKKGKGLSVDEVAASLDDAGKQIVDGGSDAIDNLFKGEGNKVYVYKDGQKVEMELQEDLYKAMLSLDTQKQNFFIKMLSVPTRMLRTGAVLSPDFGPVNILRDQFSAFVNSKYGFVPFVDMFSGMKNVLKQDDVYWQWKNAGGGNSVLSSLDREYLQGDLRKMVKQSLWETVKTKGKSPVQTLLEPLRKVSEMTEEATRLGEFKKGLKKGATPKEAAYSSRDLIDFSRAGHLGRQYNQVTAFFNASVQSVDKLARTFKENPFGASSRAAIGITLPSMVAYYYNHDKDWYREIPQRERDLYWHFEADGQVYKLPKPFEAGVLFGTTTERFLDYLKTNDKESFDELGSSLVEAFTPSWVPTAVAPWIEVYANRSMHFDSPVVPRREEGLNPEDQYGPYQSELSKVFGALTKTSPRKAEHVYKGYTGGLGKYFLMGTDAAATRLGAERPQLPDRGLADAPILNRFVVKNLEGNNQSINDFYDRMDALRRESLTAKKHNPDRENTSEFKMMNKLSREISELQGVKRNILEDMNMSGKEKTERIKEIDKQITELAKRGL